MLASRTEALSPTRLARRESTETLTAPEYDRILRVLCDCSNVRVVSEFQERLLESLGRNFGFKTTTFFLGSSFSTIWTDPEPLQTGRAVKMLKDYQNFWYQDDIFATPAALASFMSSRVSSISELSRIPDGARSFVSDYLAPADLRSGMAIYLEVSGNKKGLIGIFGDDDSSKERRELIALRMLAQPLNAISRALVAEQAEVADPTAKLPTRQREVALLVAEGLSNAMIGQLLCLQEDTVKKYVSAVLASLKCRSRTQLALLMRNSTPQTHQLMEQ
jgi:DNA-binding CsgD family transcriptional regulator